MSISMFKFTMNLLLFDFKKLLRTEGRLPLHPFNDMSAKNMRVLLTYFLMKDTLKNKFFSDQTTKRGGGKPPCTTKQKPTFVHQRKKWTKKI